MRAHFSSFSGSDNPNQMMIHQQISAELWHAEKETCPGAPNSQGETC